MVKRLDETLAKEMSEINPEQKVEALFACMERKGMSHYDEVVTQLEHALQCAHIAKLQGADEIQIVGALLHDIGHFLIDDHDGIADFMTHDFCHEVVGSEYMRPFFVDGVTEPMRLHVPAKRYICTTDDSYYETLSEASKRSFHLQGGFMSPKEKAQFEIDKNHLSAVKLRKWDDLAKVQDRKTPGLETYRVAVANCLK